MNKALKKLTTQYLRSLPADLTFQTSQNTWTRDDLLREVKEETLIGEEIVQINKSYLLSTLELA